MRTPALHLFPATAWLDTGHRVKPTVCEECFEALLAAGFCRVGTPLTERPIGDRCDVCRVRRHRGLRDPWRKRCRREFIEGLAARHDAAGG